MAIQVAAKWKCDCIDGTTLSGRANTFTWYENYLQASESSRLVCFRRLVNLEDQLHFAVL